MRALWTLIRHRQGTPSAEQSSVDGNPGSIASRRELLQLLTALPSLDPSVQPSIRATFPVSRTASDAYLYYIYALAAIGSPRTPRKEWDTHGKLKRRLNEFGQGERRQLGSRVNFRICTTRYIAERGHHSARLRRLGSSYEECVPYDLQTVQAPEFVPSARPTDDIDRDETHDLDRFEKWISAIATTLDTPSVRVSLERVQSIILPARRRKSQT